MSESRALSTITRADVDSFTKGRGEPDWLEKLRLSAFEAYFEAESPNVRNDDWRKTRIESLDLSGLSPITAQTGTAKKETRKKQFEKTLQKVAGLILQVSGSTHEIYLDEDLAKKGIILLPIDEAISKHPLLVKEHLDNGVSQEGGKLSLMTSAFFTSGAFLYIPKGVAVSDPFVIVNSISESAELGQALFPRILIVAEETADISVVNVLEGGPQGDTPQAKNERAKRPWLFVSSIIDLIAKQGSHVNYLELHNLTNQVFSVSRNNFSVHKDAHLESLTAALGGGQLKTDIITTLKERGALADIRGVAFGDGDEHFYYNTVQHHDAPDTKSNINFRVALNGKAVSSYQGNIRVAETASRTDAFQSNKNLLLKETAKAESIPRLEILTDDVKCSHGATVGPVDKNQVFYLMSRGLNKKEAEEFIVSGFFNTVLSATKVAGAAEWIESLISDKIHAVMETETKNV